MKKHFKPGDLRSAARLLAQGTQEVTQIVEGVHSAVHQTMGLGGAAEPGRTRGLTGLIYRSIEEVTGWVGRGTESALARLETMLPPAQADAATSPQREAALAALNGVMGDRLAEQGNPLAARMGMWVQGNLLDLQKPIALASARSTVVLMLHGLCMNDVQWSQLHDGVPVNHGEALAKELDGSAVYLRYNTGRHISDNGLQLADQLQALQARWPVPIERLVLLTHSMGGLVARSAVGMAQQRGMAWLPCLKQLVFLGTPHHGAPLERAGHWVHKLLGSTPFSAPFAVLARLRSAGITDLRYGHVQAQDWQDRDRFVDGRDHRTPLPLPAGVACYTVAATLAARRSRVAERLVGDGLVPLHSALGEHEDAAFTLDFAEDHQAVFHRMGHIELLASPAVQAQLLRWLG